MSPSIISETFLQSLWDGVQGNGTSLIADWPCAIRLFKTAAGLGGIEFDFPLELEPEVTSSGGFAAEIERTSGRTRIRLFGRKAENADMLNRLAVDLIGLCTGRENSNGDAEVRHCADALCERIAAWQKFMQARGHQLSAVAEEGLFGELIVFEDLLLAGVSFDRILGRWNGPVRGVHDFTFGEDLAIEVKTSLDPERFVARIHSLAQLDSGNFRVLRLAAVSLSVIDAPESGRGNRYRSPGSDENKGQTLVELVERILAQLTGPEERDEFESLVVACGFDRKRPGRRLRRFMVDRRQMFRAENLPKILPGQIPGILEASYDICLWDSTVNGETASGECEKFYNAVLAEAAALNESC